MLKHVANFYTCVSNEFTVTDYCLQLFDMLIQNNNDDPIWLPGNKSFQRMSYTVNHAVSVSPNKFILPPRPKMRHEINELLASDNRSPNDNTKPEFRIP